MSRRTGAHRAQLAVWREGSIMAVAVAVASGSPRRDVMSPGQARRAHTPSCLATVPQLLLLFCFALLCMMISQIKRIRANDHSFKHIDVPKKKGRVTLLPPLMLPVAGGTLDAGPTAPCVPHSCAGLRTLTWQGPRTGAAEPTGQLGGGGAGGPMELE